MWRGAIEVVSHLSMSERNPDHRADPEQPRTRSYPRSPDRVLPTRRRRLPPPLLAVADARALPLPDACVDLTVTSPPYALDIGYIGGDVRADRWPDFMASWLTEALRVTKPHGRLALNVPLDTTRGGQRPTYVQAWRAALAVGWTYQATITWHEGHTAQGGRALGTVNSSRRPHPIDSSEMIVLLSKGPWGPSSANPDDITSDEWQLYGRGPWRFPGEPRRPDGHPAPFPEELPYRLIRYLSRVGDVVCDPFVDSGDSVGARDQPPLLPVDGRRPHRRKRSRRGVDVYGAVTDGRVGACLVGTCERRERSRPTNPRGC